MSPDRPNLWRILSDTSRIINTHSAHFSALTVLFIFPTSLAGFAFYSLLPHPNPLETLYLRFLNIFSTTDYQIPAAGKSLLLPQLLYFLSTLILGTCAGASITYSTFHGFYGRPVEFIAALKSILVSFLPLLSTTLLVDVITGLINFAYMGLLFWALNGLVSISFDVEFYYSEYFLVFVIATAVVLVAAVFYLQIEWSLAPAVVVVESEWGLGALKRSSYLVKGARGVMFLMMLFFAVLAVGLAICYLKVAAIAGGGGSGEGWLVVIKIIVFAGFSSIILLYVEAATTVFFIYCKVSRHELDFEIDEKYLVGEYVRLSYDDVNVV
ncbi:hypothetical protein C2S51_020063 [Perilla frutescens var. frutescens]|nr:hypothetical protein C2S51_020063 [Perilla frutescens var. frutescens]